MNSIFNQIETNNDISTILELTKNASEHYICCNEILIEDTYYSIVGEVTYYSKISDINFESDYTENYIYYVQRYNERFFKVVTKNKCSNDNYKLYLTELYNISKVQLESFLNIWYDVEYNGSINNNKKLISLFKNNKNIDVLYGFLNIMSKDEYYILLNQVLLNTQDNPIITIYDIDKFITDCIINNKNMGGNSIVNSVEVLVKNILDTYFKYISKLTIKQFNDLMYYSKFKYNKEYEYVYAKTLYTRYFSAISNEDLVVIIRSDCFSSNSYFIYYIICDELKKRNFELSQINSILLSRYFYKKNFNLTIQQRLKLFFSNR